MSLYVLRSILLKLVQNHRQLLIPHYRSQCHRGPAENHRQEQCDVCLKSEAKIQNEPVGQSVGYWIMVGGNDLTPKSHPPHKIVCDTDAFSVFIYVCSVHMCDTQIHSLFFIHAFSVHMTHTYVLYFYLCSVRVCYTQIHSPFLSMYVVCIVGHSDTLFIFYLCI